MIDTVCEVWDSAVAAAPVREVVQCRSAIVIGDAGDAPRFAYVSVGSPIEQVTGGSTTLHDRSRSQISFAELTNRLLDGEVAAMLAPHAPQDPFVDELSLPQAFVERRQQIRQDSVRARFLLRQIGLEEVSGHRGAHAQLYTDIALLWSTDLALCTDPGMLLTLGADRQRYVDHVYSNRATDRLPRALGRLHDMGVRSYPRLVIV